MKLSKPKWIRTSALLAALVMVLAGLVLCRLGTPVASSTASEAGAPAAAQAQAPAATPERADEEVPADAAPAVEPADLDPQPSPTEQSTADRPARAPAPAPRKPAPPAPKPKAVTRKPVPQSSLPPFQPGAYADQTAVTSGPPPNVLWLSGVIQGDPMVAVLRRGESRYYVRQGDAIDDDYTVAGISSSEVTLRRGRSTRVLRIGKY